MAFLALDGTTIPLAYEPAEADVRTYGDEAEAEDGTMLTRHRGRKYDWGSLRTKWIAESGASTIRGKLTGAPPTAATGALTGSINVIVTLVREFTTTLADGRYRAFEFRMREE